ncbi:MAG: hypothetical protein ACQCN6_07235, partial [Candidatus Bathyarchaeia archaeon]
RPVPPITPNSTCIALTASAGFIKIATPQTESVSVVLEPLLSSYQWVKNFSLVVVAENLLYTTTTSRLRGATLFESGD